jgi:hypothetical protein
MITRGGRKAIVAIAVAVSVSATTHAQGRTDVVTLANGDRITGEIMRVERGRLEFKTDDAGTLYLEWDKLSRLVSMRMVEVLTTDGRRLLGSLGRAADRSISVVASMPLQMSEVTLITHQYSFWRKLDGSVDAGFSYTQSSGVAQLNVNSDTVFRQLASDAPHGVITRRRRRRFGRRSGIRGTVVSAISVAALVHPAAGRFRTNGHRVDAEVAGWRDHRPRWSTAIARNSCSAPGWRSIASRAWMSSPQNVEPLFR